MVTTVTGKTRAGCPARRSHPADPASAPATHPWLGQAVVASLLAAIAVTTSAASFVATPPDIRPVPQRARPLGLPAHWQHGAFMEIFVRAYADSDGDGIGDLRGLIGRLDYLKALGVRGLWLMPITASADHDHGYATVDHRAVEPAYGSLADLDELLRQTRRRGIGVVMDHVVNHSAAAHPFFEHARQDLSSPWRPWYVWADEAPQGWDIWGKNPWYHTASQPWLHTGEVKDLPPPPADARGFYFGTFGPHMPDFNMRHPAAWAYQEDTLRFWLNRGLAGFRLDAVPHLVENSAAQWNDQPESRALTKRLQDLVKRYPQRMVVCEATAEPQDYGDPAVCGGAFAFGYSQHFVGAARGQAESVQALASYYRTARPTMATFVSNHDIFAGQRLWDQVAGDEARYKLAAASYLLQPGTPFIYYGEEVGQAGVNHLPGDQPLRAPMSWAAEAATTTVSANAIGPALKPQSPAGAALLAPFTTGTPFRPLAPNLATHNAAAQARDPGSILAFYKAMLALRNGRPSIARGSFEHSQADGLLLAFQRALGLERSLVLINYATEARPRQAVGALPPGARLQRLYPATARPAALRADAQGQVLIDLPAQQVQVFAVRPAAASTLSRRHASATR